MNAPFNPAKDTAQQLRVRTGLCWEKTEGGFAVRDIPKSRADSWLTTLRVLHLRTYCAHGAHCFSHKDAAPYDVAITRIDGKYGTCSLEIDAKSAGAILDKLAAAKPWKPALPTVAKSRRRRSHPDIEAELKELTGLDWVGDTKDGVKGYVTGPHRAKVRLGLEDRLRQIAVPLDPLDNDKVMLSHPDAVRFLDMGEPEVTRSR